MLADIMPIAHHCLCDLQPIVLQILLLTVQDFDIRLVVQSPCVVDSAVSLPAARPACIVH